jgi:hypothetical protein
MAWSIFTQGGGSGAALTWSDDLLTKIGAPLTPGDEQFVYDWEVTEGGGGKFNPLNQGPVPGDPSLTTTGSQFGGGAADYASWNAGLTGAADYLAMGSFSTIASDLRADNPAGARSALIASPWAASHYDNGSAFSDAAIPGKASALPGGTGTAGSGDTSILGIFDPSSYIKAAGSAISGLLPGGVENDIESLGKRLGFIFMGVALILTGLYLFTKDR